MSQTLQAPDRVERSDPLAQARALAPLIESLAASGEAEGTMPAELVAAFRDTGLFWLALPAELGGGGADLITTLETLEEVSRSDGSTGWSLMANMSGTALAGAFVGDAAAQRMFGGGRRAITAGMLAVPAHGSTRSGGPIRAVMRAWSSDRMIRKL